MIRAYGLLAAAALLVNGPTMAPLIAYYQQATSDDGRAIPAETRAPAAFAADADRGRDGLFRLTGLANRRRVRFVVDTGATVTVLSAPDAARLGLSPRGADGSGTLRTAGGAAAMTWKTLSHLDIAGSHLTDLDVVVVRDGPDHSLLGQDVLSRLGTITMTSGRLEIRRPAA